MDAVPVHLSISDDREATTNAAWLRLVCVPCCVFPREGIGCWNSVFPAGAHDIWLQAAATVKELERICGVGGAVPELVVYERIEVDDVFNGLQRLDS